MLALRPDPRTDRHRLTEGEHISIWCTGGSYPVHLTGYIKLKLASLGGELQVPPPAPFLFLPQIVTIILFSPKMCTST